MRDLRLDLPDGKHPVIRYRLEPRKVPVMGTCHEGPLLPVFARY
jgi:hypothetical protein